MTMRLLLNSSSPLRPPDGRPDRPQDDLQLFKNSRPPATCTVHSSRHYSSCFVVSSCVTTLHSLHSSLPSLFTSVLAANSVKFTPSHIQHHLTCNTIVMASEYEQARVANIKRNEEFLKNIGLGDLQRDIRQSADTAAAASQSSSRASSGKSAQRKRQRGEAARTSREEGTQAPRRSRRLQSPAAMGAKGDTTTAEEEIFLYLKDAQGATSVPKRSSWKYRYEQDVGDDEELPERIRPQQLLDYIMAADESHFEQTDTAGVALCCERINSMSEAGLNLRLQRIKQTNKLILFYYGLTLAGMTRLAESAKDKLARFHKVIIK